MPTVPAADQRRLLDVAELDSKIAQAQHRRATLPAATQLADVDTELEIARGEAAAAAATQSDLDRAVRKAEADVEQVRARTVRNNDRLHSGVGTAKEMVALQSELEMLARRQTELEDVLLEVMERQESAHAQATEHQAAVAQLEERRAEVAAQVEAQRQELDAEAAELTRQRDSISTGLDPWLVAQYDRLRQRGKGAAALRARRCGNCGFELSATDIAAFRAAGPDDVLRCEECSCILVRTEESGL